MVISAQLKESHPFFFLGGGVLFYVLEIILGVIYNMHCGIGRCNEIFHLEPSKII